MLGRDEFEAVADIDQVPDEGTLGVVTPGGAAICLVRHAGRITALADICTHQEFAMSLGDVLEDGTIQCAWHGARFDCVTGAVRQGPAAEPLPVHAIRIEDGRVFVGPRCDLAGGAYVPSEAWIAAGGDTA